MTTNNHPAKDKAHKLRPNLSTASKPAASENKSRKPDVAADGFQPGSHIDRQAQKNWEERDRPDVENRKRGA